MEFQRPTTQADLRGSALCCHRMPDRLNTANARSKRAPRDRRLAVGVTWLLATVALSCLVTTKRARAQNTVPIVVPSGFRVEQFADDRLATNICCMTTDCRGRVVVSGPGYIRTLIDSDHDGRADTFEVFADGPQSGAQGLCFTGAHLIATGDNGLLVFRDDDKDGAADGDPDVILRLKAGKEHHAHAVRRGPDGWWYVIAGNMTGVDSSYATLPSSPITRPSAGVLLRLKPDFSGGEIVCDGLRNAYDFTFAETRDIFTFDSDGERDVSLPWYVPIRVLQAEPGSHAGWVSRSWKRPVDLPDSPQTVSMFGRGSPTGVLCYRHSQFPGRYRGAIFVEDWTFGRIIAVSLKRRNGQWEATTAEFAKAKRGFGFAPTAMAVAPDGSLYVSVGGRGTRGAVYRISYPDGARQALSSSNATSPARLLDSVLQAPQPLAAWSRQRWLPAARQLGAAEFSQAATDELLPARQRVRAVEILVDVFGGPDQETVRRLAESRSSEVRAATAWAIGRSRSHVQNEGAVTKLLDDADINVRLAAMEALLSASDRDLMTRRVPQLAVLCSLKNRIVERTVSRVIARLTEEQQRRLELLVGRNVRAQASLQMARCERSDAFSEAGMRIAVQILRDAKTDSDTLLTALRLLQLSLGDVGPVAGRPSVLDGYRTRIDLAPLEATVSDARTAVERRIMTGSPEDGRANTNRELLRCLSLLGSKNPGVTDAILSQITGDSHPTDDLHRLIVLSNCTAPRTKAQVQQIAHALVALDDKISRRALKQDSNWDDRLAELYELHTMLDDRIPEHVVDASPFGLPGHVLFLRHVPPEKTQAAIERFAARADRDSAYPWTNDVVFVLGRSQNRDHIEIVRRQAGNPVVADAVTLVLARRPEPKDRPLFVRGLNSHRISVVAACVDSLKRLPRSNDPREQFALLAVARRLNHNKAEYELRETVVRMLQNNNLRSFQFVFGPRGHVAQPEALEKWKHFLQTRFPELRHLGDGDRTAHAVMSRLDKIDWGVGDVARGRQVAEKLKCTVCHSQRSAMGPDLAGVTNRFSRKDVFAAIVDPHRDVADRYLVTTVVTRDGIIYSGLIVYESVDGVTLKDGDGDTIRIESADIDFVKKSRMSLMPTGLLRDASDQDLADLYAWLQSLTPDQTAAP